MYFGLGTEIFVGAYPIRCTINFTVALNIKKNLLVFQSTAQNISSHRDGTKT